MDGARARVLYDRVCCGGLLLLALVLSGCDQMQLLTQSGRVRSWQLPQRTTGVVVENAHESAQRPSVPALAEPQEQPVDAVLADEQVSLTALSATDAVAGDDSPLSSPGAQLHAAAGLGPAEVLLPDLASGVAMATPVERRYGNLAPVLVNVPWQPGDVVAVNAAYYRRFLETTRQGYRVQDFYQTQPPQQVGGGPRVLPDRLAGAAQSRRDGEPLPDGMDLAELPVADGGNYSDMQAEIKLTEPFVLLQLADVTSTLPAPRPVKQQYAWLSQLAAHGSYVLWYANGRQAIAGGYWQGKRQGQWRMWYENGNLMLQEHYDQGANEGGFAGWYSNGVPAGQGQYHRGLRQGEWVLWFNNGQKMEQGVYESGAQQGAWAHWYDNGQLRLEGLYQQGQRIGPWRWWTRDGELAREAQYLGDASERSIGSGTIEPRWR